jgi:hypothetical protein
MPRIKEHCEQILINEPQEFATPISAVLSPNLSRIGGCRRNEGSLTSRIFPVLQSHTTIFTPSPVFRFSIKTASLEFVMDTE